MALLQPRVWGGPSSLGVRLLTVSTGSTPLSTRGPLGGRRCRRVRQDAADSRALPHGQKTEDNE